MRFSVQVAPVVGQQNEAYWSQVLVLPEMGKLESGPLSRNDTLVAVALTVKGEEAYEAGRDILVYIREEQQGLVAGEGSLDSWWRQLVEERPEISSLVVLMLQGNQMNLMGYGGGRVVLKRGGEMGLVLVAPEDGWRHLEGVVRDGDRILLGTQGLIVEMSADLVDDVLAMEEVKLAGEELVTRVQSAQESAQAAGYILHFAGQTDEMEIEEPGEDEEEGPDVSEPREEVILETEAELHIKQPEVFLRKPPGKKRLIGALFLMLMVVLGASVWMGMKYRENQAWERKYEVVALRVAQLVGEAEEIMGGDRVGAQALLMEARLEVDRAQPDFEAKPSYSLKLTELDEELVAMIAKVSGEQALLEVPMWVDLAVLREGAFGTRMALSGNLLVVLDAQNRVLYTVDGTSKKMERAGGGELLGEALMVGAHRGRAVVKASSGLVEWSLANKTAAVLKEVDPDWKNIVEVGMFAGNVYLLDKGQASIWLYPGLESGVGTKRQWFTGNRQIDLSGVVDMAIDGDIWLGYENGQLERYRRGERVNFTVSGLVEPMRKVVQIYTDETLEQVYLLDQGNNRVVVVSKEGQFERQIVWQGLAAASDLAVLSQEKAMVVLSGSSLYRIALD
jgi:hypothetical protein